MKQEERKKKKGMLEKKKDTFNDRIQTCWIADISMEAKFSSSACFNSHCDCKWNNVDNNPRYEYDCCDETGELLYNA